MIQKFYSWANIQRKLIQKDTCTPMFTALFTIAKVWKQPNVHQQVNRQDVEHLCTHILQHSSAMKTGEAVPCAATGVDLEIIILSQVCKRKTKKSVRYMSLMKFLEENIGIKLLDLGHGNNDFLDMTPKL